MIGQPLIQLLLYGFVFQVVLRSRWGIQTPSGQDVPFGLLLFGGILLHGLLADTLVRAPSLIISNTSYVKRVIFPLEILPLVNVASTVTGVFFGMIILVAGSAYYAGHLSASILLVPIPVASLVVFTVGVGWLLSAVGVFFRDLAQLTSSLATIMLFTAPICYPAEMVPVQFRWLLNINPLTIPVEAVRSLIFSSGSVNWSALVGYSLVAGFTAALGYFVFHRMRAGFADVL
ncbi:lipopolysaccharide transport system permease protein [Pseudomonas abietaniphila]|uniref:Transport permease protein n=2 Tax=Pseudomonas abietaniphila TaxID=89065 RepID=A0A1G8BSK9_9PSED|nr:lipopolysaccharide transport system permease protein [Pseudomonas abietaniphila]